MESLSWFIYHYPLIMAVVWVIGACLYQITLVERHRTPLSEYPKVSILVPCHNEGAIIEEILFRMMDLDYPEYEIVALNDGSTDNTLEILIGVARAHYPKIRVVNIIKNQGKANALNTGILASQGEYLVCIDADSFLAKDALKKIMWHFMNGRKVGAVTGNPRIRNRTTLLGKLQVAEYSSIIGMIKRTQRALLHRVFTVSGVVAAFRKRAVLDVGLWHDKMATEDIDITWRLQLKDWEIRFEEQAICWILTPETVSGLWKQRVRWAQGGVEVVRGHYRKLFTLKQWRFCLILIDYIIGIIWVYLLFFMLGIAFIHMLSGKSALRFLPTTHGSVLLIGACLLQTGIAIFFERKIEKHYYRYLFWFILYPFFYWALNAAATIVAVPKTFFGRKQKQAVWDSPDRGIR